MADLFSQWTAEQGGAWISDIGDPGGGRAASSPLPSGSASAMRACGCGRALSILPTRHICYLPRGLPEPRDSGLRERGGRRRRAGAAGQRRARFRALFTSHQSLQRAAEQLGERLDYPLLVQGTAPRDELLRRFRTTPRAVLLGTASFWEGVDVRGEALSCVIIDKLPFAPPDDPINEARARALKAAGRDPFMEHQLPQAVIALKQGVGRLIRDADDRGVVVLCDPRLLSKAYGRVFIDSLPPMPLAPRHRGCGGLLRPSMKLLAIETASDACSGALLVDDGCFERYRIAPRQHAGVGTCPWSRNCSTRRDWRWRISMRWPSAAARAPLPVVRIGAGVIQGLAYGRRSAGSAGILVAGAGPGRPSGKVQAPGCWRPSTHAWAKSTGVRTQTTGVA